MVKCVPQSDVRTEGRPNLATQETRNALTQDSAVMELNGAISGQCVVHGRAAEGQGGGEIQKTCHRARRRL